MKEPVESVIELTKSFIKRRYRINAFRIIVCVVAVLAAVFIIYQVITKLGSLTEINSYVFASFIAMAGILLGTVAYGILQPTLTTAEKINDAKEINKKMVKDSKKAKWHGYVEFFKHFNDVLEKFYK